MRLTIIPIDKTVYLDGKCYPDIDLSWIPDIEDKKVHAIQWLDEDNDGIGEGEIEFVGPDQNLKITTLGIEGFCSFQKAIDQWNEKKEEEEALYQEYLAEQQRLKQEEEDRIQANFLSFNQAYLPVLEDEDEDGNVKEDEEEENIFYDIEELLKEI
jgi:hypothetical protein